MAYWIDASTKANNSRQFSFYMDTDADKNSLPTTVASGVQQGEDTVSCLPCGKGSTAFSIASGSVFVLNSNNEWMKIGG